MPETVVRLGSSLDPDTIREGTDVYFDCIVAAHPIVYKVEWRHNVRIYKMIFYGTSQNLFAELYSSSRT